MTDQNFQFIPIEKFEELFRPLRDPEKAWANLLLKAAARWIKRKLPEIADDNQDAIVVSVAVVKSALESMSHGGLSSFTNTLGPRSKAGTLVNPEAALVWLDWMYDQLGISRNTQPAYYFGNGDCHAQW